jgi:orotidine-5'-phosphate decarboxylase
VAVVQKTHIDASERLIIALDVPAVAEANSLVRELDGVVKFFKIGMELYVSSGIALIPELVDKQKRVFLDLKFFDVPETVKSAVERVAATGASFLTIHGTARTIQAAVEGRGTSPLKLLAVTVLTSLDLDDMKELGLLGGRPGHSPRG